MGDVDALLALVTDDYIRMVPNKPAIVGKEAFRDSIQSFFDGCVVQDEKVSIEEVRLAVDWAYARGSWNNSIIIKTGGDPISKTGKWMVICERQVDKSWKISRASVSEDALSEITW